MLLSATTNLDFATTGNMRRIPYVGAHRRPAMPLRALRKAAALAVAVLAPLVALSASLAAVASARGDLIGA